LKAEANTGLSREFVIKSIADYLETAEKERRWGGVSVLVQDGRCRTIKEERTITREAAYTKKIGNNLKPSESKNDRAIIWLNAGGCPFFVG